MEKQNNSITYEELLILLEENLDWLRCMFPKSPQMNGYHLKNVWSYRTHSGSIKTADSLHEVFNQIVEPYINNK